jgi:BlaI family penicillinase repressor
MSFKELTKAEEQVMQIIWEKGQGFVNDFMESLPDPRPAYNTVSTIVRILEKKGFVGHRAFGKSHEYFPLVDKQDYTRTYFQRFLENYFQNSFGSLVSFFAEKQDLSLAEMEKIRQMMDDKLKIPNENE